MALNHTAKAEVGRHHRCAAINCTGCPFAGRCVCVRVCTGLQTCACLHQAAAANLPEVCTQCLKLCRSKSVISVLQHMVSLLAVPCSRTTRCRRRSFAVSGPTVWNTLPPIMHDPSLTQTQFCALLKTMMFCEAYETLP